MEELLTDVLILGSGGAGLLAALHSADADSANSVTLVTKGLIGKSGCTRLVQGGYNAVLNPRDSLQMHFGDTLKGGQFINNQELAWALVSNAPKTVRELETRVGCFFDRDSQGNIHQKAFAGQSFDRTVHRGDLTGIEIVSRLRDQVFRRPNVRVIEECRAIDLLMDPEGRAVVGAVLLHIRTGEFMVARAKAVLIATGGGARMYKISAPSMEKSGDGVAMAWRAGAVLLDMEMLQFHPTGLLAGNSRLTGSVLEEGLRGSGGHLYNGQGERFMGRYDPVRLERSTRDQVARAIYMEIMAGRGTPDGGVCLDVSHLGAKFVEKNFPGMVDRVHDVGKDLAREPVEISPTAHFHMGGIRIDTACRSSIEGLFAAGEDAAGVHGANRLGGNGVGESTVFGCLAGDSMAEYITDKPAPRPYSKAQAEAIVQRALAPFSGRENGENPFALRAELEDLMWRKVGVTRNEKNLREALDDLAVLQEKVQRLTLRGSLSYNMAWNDTLNLANNLIIARATALGALHRTESRGAHYREDFPGTNNQEWLKNIFMQRQEPDDFRVFEEPVQLTRMKPADLS